jgi:hypothetical protein
MDFEDRLHAARMRTGSVEILTTAGHQVVGGVRRVDLVAEHVQLVRATDRVGRTATSWVGFAQIAALRVA